MVFADVFVDLWSGKWVCLMGRKVHTIYCVCGGAERCEKVRKSARKGAFRGAEMRAKCIEVRAKCMEVRYISTDTAGGLRKGMGSRELGIEKAKRSGERRAYSGW